MASPPIMSGGSFSAAKEAYELVQGQIDAMTERANAALEQANSVINTLTSFAPITPPPDPSPPRINPSDYVLKPSDAAAPAVPADLVSGIDDMPPIELQSGAELITDLNGIDSDLGQIGEFDPSVTITLPSPPSPIDTGDVPAAPTLRDVSLPTAPSPSLPALDSLEEISIPSFTFPTLPTFDALAPEFDGELPSISALAQWSEPRYETELIADVLVTVRKMLNGETGLPAPIEEAIYARARAREDLTARQNVQQAFDTWAGRGFVLPPGMLVEQVNAAQDEAALRTNAVSREVAIEVTRIAIENLRQAVAQGIAAEQTLYNFFANAVQRSFEMARARLDAEVALCNAQVGLFNARSTAYQVAAQVFEARLRAALAEIDVYKAQIDGARAISDFNESKVRIYVAKVDALKASVEVYRAQMEGAKVESEFNQSRIESYRASVDAYKAKIEARKVVFDAYEAQVRGESAKANIVQAQADAFASTVRAVEAKSNIRVAKVNARISALQASVGKFTAQTQYEREKVGAQAQVAQAKISAFSADVQRYAAELQANTSANEAQIRTLDVYLRTQLSQYEIAVKRYEALLTTIIEQAKIQADSIRAAGQMASQLAAGAMSAMQVGATVRGGGDINYNESYSTQVQYDTEF
jgi:hypothetical protein